MAALEEFSLGRVLGAANRLLIGEHGFGFSTDASEQVRANGVEEVVIPQGQALDDDERRRRPLDLGHRHRAVQCHDRARREHEEPVVQLQNLPPVGSDRDWRVAVDGIDRRLELVGTGLGCA